jgi:hypothetical protein
VEASKAFGAGKAGPAAAPAAAACVGRDGDPTASGAATAAANGLHGSEGRAAGGTVKERPLVAGLLCALAAGAPAAAFATAGADARPRPAAAVLAGDPSLSEPPGVSVRRTMLSQSRCGLGGTRSPPPPAAGAGLLAVMAGLPTAAAEDSGLAGSCVGRWEPLSVAPASAEGVAAEA